MFIIYLNILLIFTDTVVIAFVNNPLFLHSFANGTHQILFCGYCIPIVKAQPDVGSHQSNYTMRSFFDLLFVWKAFKVQTNLELIFIISVLLRGRSTVSTDDSIRENLHLASVPTKIGPLSTIELDDVCVDSHNSMG